MSNIHSNHKGLRVISRGERARRLAADFPGWGADNYADYLLPTPAGLHGQITNVESHGQAPYTRYTIRWDDGTRSIGTDPANVAFAR